MRGFLCYNTDMVKFSIIIPCFNATEYVDRALKSAVNQNFDKDCYEVIAVNDASTDDTLSKLIKWQTEYPNLVKVISYDINLRQGGARNVAMKEAKGEFVCFLDADDWMSSNCLAVYDGLLDATGADMAVSRHVDENEFTESDEKTENVGDLEILRVYNTQEDYSDIIKADFGYVWCAAYRRQIIVDNDIWFPEHLAYEDISWPRLYRLYAKVICVSGKVTHHKYDNPISTMNVKNAAHHLDRLTVYEMLLKEYRDRGIIEKEYDTILNATMEIYYFNSYYMFFTRMEEIPDVYLRIRNTINEFFPSWQNRYDDSKLPMIFQYMVKLLARIPNASANDLQPFKEAMLELIK